MKDAGPVLQHIGHHARNKQQLLSSWQYKLAPSELLLLIQQFVKRCTGKQQMLLSKKFKFLNWLTMILK